MYTVPAVAHETKARETVEKLNSLAELENKDGWQEEYYSVPMTL
jgi:hypothetical protein